LATQALQANNATTITACAVIDSLLRLRGADSWTKSLGTRARARSAFFHPALKRAEVNKEMRDLVFDMVRGVLRGIGGDGVLADWTRFKVQPPLPASEDFEYDTAAFITWWADQSTLFPHLKAAIVAVAQLNPTEAECERAFSCCKFCFHVCGRRPRGGNSAVAFLNRHSFEDVDAVDVDAEPSNDVGEISTKMTGKQAANILNTWHVVVYKAAEPAVTRRRADRVNDQLCAVCQRGHEEGASWVMCNGCSAWFAFACVGISADDEALVRAMERWHCPTCRHHYA
jgi:hypothetical protein